MTDFAQWRAAPADLKKALPIPYVMEQAGVRCHLDGERLVALCPWHPDRTPSLYMVKIGDSWRWGCWSCGFAGDVIDLIRQFRPEYSFSRAVAAGEMLVARMTEQGWKEPVLESSSRAWDESWARQLMAEARRQADKVAGFIAAKGYPFSAEFVVHNFGVGAVGTELIVPIYNADRQLVGAKHRRLDASDHLFAFPGSKLADVFYDEQRLPACPIDVPVVLCEGESDTWMAAWASSGAGRFAVGSFLALGVAAGAGAPPRAASRLTGRDVHIVFDGDNAGRMGARRWAEELARVGARPVIHDLPDGEDLCSYGAGWLEQVFG